MKYLLILCLLIAVTAKGQDYLVSKTKYDTLQKNVDALIKARDDTSKTVKMYVQAASSMTSTSRRIIADTIFSPNTISAGVVTCNISRFGYTNAASMNVQVTMQCSVPVFCQVKDYSISTVSFNLISLAGVPITQLTTLTPLSIHIKIGGY